jgi:hypothetical protein
VSSASESSELCVPDALELNKKKTSEVDIQITSSAIQDGYDSHIVIILVELMGFPSLRWRCGVVKAEFLDDDQHDCDRGR